MMPNPPWMRQGVIDLTGDEQSRPPREFGPSGQEAARRMMSLPPGAAGVGSPSSSDGRRHHVGGTGSPTSMAELRVPRTYPLRTRGARSAGPGTGVRTAFAATRPTADQDDSSQEWKKKVLVPHTRLSWRWHGGRDSLVVCCDFDPGADGAGLSARSLRLERFNNRRALLSKSRDELGRLLLWQECRPKQMQQEPSNVLIEAHGHRIQGTHFRENVLASARQNGIAGFTFNDNEVERQANGRWFWTRPDYKRMPQTVYFQFFGTLNQMLVGIKAVLDGPLAEGRDNFDLSFIVLVWDSSLAGGRRVPFAQIDHREGAAQMGWERHAQRTAFFETPLDERVEGYQSQRHASLAALGASCSRI